METAKEELCLHVLEVGCKMVTFRRFAFVSHRVGNADDDLVSDHSRIYPQPALGLCFVCEWLPKVIAFCLPS